MHGKSRVYRAAQIAAFSEVAWPTRASCKSRFRQWVVGCEIFFHRHGDLAVLVMATRIVIATR